jgi:hypothetical protein
MAKPSILERIDSGEKGRSIRVTSERVSALSRCTNEPLQRRIGSLGGGRCHIPELRGSLLLQAIEMHFFT